MMHRHALAVTHASKAWLECGLRNRLRERWRYTEWNTPWSNREWGRTENGRTVHFNFFVKICVAASINYPFFSPMCVCRLGSRPWSSGLWKPWFLLAVCTRHAHLELRRTHICSCPGMFINEIKLFSVRYLQLKHNANCEASAVN